MSGLEPIIIASAIGAGASHVTAKKQQRAQERIASKRLESQKRLAEKKRIADVTAMEQERRGERQSSMLASAQAQQMRNLQLQQRGIAPRKLGGFGEITKSVLDEGAV